MLTKRIELMIRHYSLPQSIHACVSHSCCFDPLMQLRLNVSCIAKQTVTNSPHANRNDIDATWNASLANRHQVGSMSVSSLWAGLFCAWCTWSMRAGQTSWKLQKSMTQNSDFKNPPLSSEHFMECIFGSRADVMEQNPEKHDTIFFLIYKKPFIVGTSPHGMHF